MEMIDNIMMIMPERMKAVVAVLISTWLVWHFWSPVITNAAKAFLQLNNTKEAL